MNAPVAVLLLFAALGAVDEALGGKLGVAPAFRNGLAAMGPLCLSMAGIYSVAVSALSGMAGQGGGALPFDAALPAGAADDIAIVLDTTNAAEIRAFVWDGFENMTPLSNSFSLTL